MGLAEFPVRVLVADDYKAWLSFVSAALAKQPELELIGQASDGFEAVQQAQQLRPDLILLDIGLPTLNGIEAARQIRENHSCKILFLSENRAGDIVEEALSTGAGGYVVKSDSTVNCCLLSKPFSQAKRLSAPACLCTLTWVRTDLQPAIESKTIPICCCGTVNRFPSS